jgi:hypothetical protein
MISNWRESGSNGLWVPIIVVGAIFVYAALKCKKAILRFREIEKTPVWEALAVYGQPRQLSSEIEQDLLAGSVKYGNLKITPHWLIQKSLFDTWTSPVAEVAWAYKGITQHKTNGIPTGKTYSVTIVGRHGQRTTVKASKSRAEALMLELMQRVPYAIFGYSDDLKKAWNSDKRGFLAAVDDRKQRFATK